MKRYEPWMDEYEAPNGAEYICGACGKRNSNRVLVGDEACFLNAVLVKMGTLEAWNES